MSKIGVFFAEGLEEIEGLTVVDLCRRAGITVDMIAVSDHKQIKGAHGIIMHTDLIFAEEDFDTLDAICLPGGMPGTKHLQEYAGVTEQVKAFVAADKLTTAICAAPSVLANAGVLAGKSATVYPGCEGNAADVNWTGESVVRDGRIITGKGPGAAMLFALEIIGALEGEEKKKEVKNGLMMPE